MIIGPLWESHSDRISWPSDSHFEFVLHLITTLLKQMTLVFIFQYFFTIFIYTFLLFVEKHLSMMMDLAMRGVSHRMISKYLEKDYGIQLR